MFPGRFFAWRYWARRYFTKAGGVTPALATPPAAGRVYTPSASRRYWTAT